MRNRGVCAAVCVAALLLSAAPAVSAAQEPRPVLTGLVPASCWAGSGDTTVTVLGQNFVQVMSPQLQPVAWTMVRLDGVSLTTTYVSSTTLVAVIPAASLTTPGYRAVSVQSPPFAGDSTSLRPLPLEVRSETSVPQVGIIVPGGAGGVHRTPVVVSFVATDEESGVTRLEYRCPPLADDWTAGAQLVLPLSTGTYTVEARAVDVVGHTGSATATIAIEQVFPVPKALADVTARLGRRARLRFRVDEPAGASATVTAEIRIFRAADGRQVKSVVKESVPVGLDVAAEVALLPGWCTPGRYVWKVYATDVWGSQQVKPSAKRLTVTR